MKNINTAIIILVFFWFTNQLQAQQTPPYNQSLYTPESFNPARMGKGFLSLGYRQQYLDLGTASPRSYFLSADFSKALGLEDKHIGLGISLQADQAHIINRNQLNGLFAYHLIKAEGIQISAGISAGVLLQQIKFGDARVNDPSDLAIFNAAESKFTFEGGPALALSLNPGQGSHHIAIDATLPQLFTSDIKYRNGQIIADLQPHLQFRAAYRFESEAISIEPLLMYRDLLGNKKVSAAGMDGALKLGFLGDRFWVGAGMRLNADTYHFTGGVNVVKALQLQAGMELHSQLGNSIEVGLLYRFYDDKKEVVKVNYLDSLKIAFAASGLNLEAFENDKNVFLEKLSQQESRLETLNTPKSYTEKLNVIGSIEAQIPLLKSELSNLHKFEGPAKASFDKAEAAVTGRPQLEPRQEYHETSDNYQLIINSNRQFAQRIEALETKTKSSRASLLPEIIEVVTKGSNERIRDFFQKRINELVVKPRDLRPLVVETVNNKPVLVYQFPNGIEQFDVYKNELAEVRSLLEHCIAQINDLKANRLRVSSISLLAQLRDNEQQTRTPAGNYNQELGNAPLSITYQFMASPTTNPIPRTKTIRVGGISVNDLSVLKIYSMRKYLEAKEIFERINLEQSIQNRDQGPLQLYTIRIYLEK